MAEMGTTPTETPVETPAAVEAEPVVETPAKPDFLDPRFNTVEDQARAYRDAEKKMQQEANRRAALERELSMRQYQESQRPATPQVNAEPQENLDETFWQKPTEVIDKLVSRRLGEVTKQLEPFVEDRLNQQKSKYANDPVFKELEPQIDQVFKLQPELKKQAGSVDYIYNFLRAQTFDPAMERERIKAEIRAEMTGANRQTGQIEGAGSPSAGPAPTPKMELTDDERRAAQRFYSDMPPQEAYKRYWTSKQAWNKGGA